MSEVKSESDVSNIQDHTGDEQQQNHVSVVTQQPNSLFAAVAHSSLYKLPLEIRRMIAFDKYRMVRTS